MRGSFCKIRIESVGLAVWAGLLPRTVARLAAALLPRPDRPRDWAASAAPCLGHGRLIGPLPCWPVAGRAAGPPVALAAGPAGATAWAACSLGQAELGRFND